MRSDWIVTVVLDEQNGNDNHWACLHQCLLMLLDSPLNQSKYLEVYIRLIDRRLIKLHREVRIPRTFKRFEQLFSNFLNGCDMPVVQTQDGPVRLLTFVSKSIDKHLPSKGLKVRISNLAPRFKRADHFADLLKSSDLKNITIFIDFGPVDFNILGEGRDTEYEMKTINTESSEDLYSISRYPISSSLTCVKVCTAFERFLLETAIDQPS